ncbi:ATP-binding protein [Solirubrobacter soli]|uniref:ATP-binding protein n=1 Tax=Solirubrobacter soli TaxID=363832 RepID=UPI000414CB18|nr:ATP-binding protein [Solirubrobacter soli]
MSTSPARLLAAIADRTGATGVIAGPPGSGKSALLDNLERRARAAGWITRRASHVASERHVPYTAIRALFDEPLSPERSIAETGLALSWHCASIARHAPIALLVDDAQWADRASLKVLAQLARRASDLPLLVVLATRPHAGDATPDVASIFGGERIRLERRGTRDEAATAWHGLQTGTLSADVCAALARSALLQNPHSLEALHTLILTDRVSEANASIARLGTGDPAVSLLAAELALRVGRRADAEREARRAGADGLDVLVAALIGRGACGEAREALLTREAPAGLLLAEGDFDAAVTAAREEGWRCIAQGRTNPAAAGWRTTLALSLAHAGHLEDAAAVADDEIALARAFGAPTALARALHARCVAEPDLEARAALAEAVLATPTPATLLHASARIELGIAHLRLGHRAEAREALAAAAAVADAAGARPMAERARRALAACAAPPRGDAPGRPATPARGDAPAAPDGARLAARGMSDRPAA